MSKSVAVDVEIESHVLRPHSSPANSYHYGYKGMPVVTQEMISHLPLVVRKWLARSNVLGKEMIQSVKLTQTGQMRTSPKGRWLPVEAEQSYTVDPPGFSWVADVRLAPWIHLSGRDSYQNGKGRMLIKLFSLFPVTNATGPEIDQGALHRFLAEIIWFPTAALARYITWKEINSSSAEASMSYEGVTASAQFCFSADGDVRSLDANRYYDRKTGPTLEHWHIDTDSSGYKVFEGFRIPARSTVTWKLKEGDFTWYRLEITDIRYTSGK